MPSVHLATGNGTEAGSEKYSGMSKRNQAECTSDFKPGMNVWPLPRPRRPNFRPLPGGKLEVRVLRKTSPSRPAPSSENTVVSRHLPESQGNTPGDLPVSTLAWWWEDEAGSPVRIYNRRSAFMQFSFELVLPVWPKKLQAVKLV